MEQIPLFPEIEKPKDDTSSSVTATPAINPLNDKSVEPDASLFPDPEKVAYAKWDDVDKKWIPVYRPDDPGEMYKYKGY